MKPRYSIKIAHSRNKKYAVYWTKDYGVYSGGVSGRDTAEECVRFIREQVLKSWRELDGIAGHEPDAVTLKNTHFESVTDEITLSEILNGQHSLASFGVSE